MRVPRGVKQAYRAKNRRLAAEDEIRTAEKTLYKQRPRILLSLAYGAENRIKEAWTAFDDGDLDEALNAAQEVLTAIEQAPKHAPMGKRMTLPRYLRGLGK